MRSRLNKLGTRKKECGPRLVSEVCCPKLPFVSSTRPPSLTSPRFYSLSLVSKDSPCPSFLRPQLSPIQKESQSSVRKTVTRVDLRGETVEGSLKRVCNVTQEDRPKVQEETNGM